MASTSLAQFFRKIADIWLTASVHLDAFRAEPQAYLTATRWRIKRKRVRARGQFAPLLSQSPRAYQLWVLRQERQGRDPSPKGHPPIIALIDMAANPDPKALSITQQSLIAEGLSTLTIGSPQTPDLAAAIAQVEWDADPWLLPVCPGDRIEPGTASAYRNVIGKTDARIIYADDDLITGRRRAIPYFKPDWNAELFVHQDYLTGACIIQATRADFQAIAGKEDWASELVAKLAHQERPPVHLHAMLHHRQHRPMPRLPARPLAIVRDLPPISVIVPTRNRVDLLRTCLDGVAEADYPHVEVIIIDNDSDDPDTLAYLAALDPARHRVLHHAGAFNYSAINNRGAGEARGRLLCLLNNDIETTDRDWLSIMATQALRPEVGAVGARLLYPDGRIQHAGVVIGVGNAAGHAHRFLRPEEEGYFHRHSLPQFTMAVTAACLVVERDKFMAVGGLNEVDFPVAFNDVDLCLRLNQKGWHSLYEPRATLIHHESVSRGLDRDPVGAARFASELAALKRIWKTDEIYDPYHHPELSRASEQFAVAL
tara:strand:+ start:1037 stop:2659 length:1623 start_codon:yes stop_codon:yes gene_type:complete